jgi:hypothetical protein
MLRHYVAAGRTAPRVLPSHANSAGRRRVFDELGRWLSAYLSGQIRDQLL